MIKRLEGIYNVDMTRGILEVDSYENELFNLIHYSCYGYCHVERISRIEVNCVLTMELEVYESGACEERGRGT